MVSNTSLRSLLTIILSTLRTLLPNILLRLPGEKSPLQCNGISSLPEDLLTGILLRLPVKSLLQCKLVCKEWHAIIASSSFIKTHFNDDSNLTSLVLYANDLHSGSYYPDETIEKHRIPHNLLLWGNITYVSGPCNGIYCLSVRKNKFALWNPTTRRLRLIQCCPSYVFDEVGFGMDPLTGDFKIVLIHARHDVSPWFAVYTSSNDSWKYLAQETLGDSEAFISYRENTYLNGFHYWIKKKDAEDPNTVLLAFDMHNEIFEETKMPEIAVDREFLHYLNDSLALVSYDPYNCNHHTEIWLMKGKGRWTKFLSVVLPLRCLFSLGFWGRNKMLVLGWANDTTQLIEYDLDSHAARQVKYDVAARNIFPVFFKESIFSLKDKDGIQDYDTRSAEALEYLGYKRPITKPIFNASQLGLICAFIIIYVIQFSIFML